MRKQHNNSLKFKIVSVCLSVCLTASTLNTGIPLVGPKKTYAAGNKITMSTCRSLALENSPTYESRENSVESKKAAQESALKALKLKKKDLATFRYTPLLSFKFPEKANFQQESDFQFKPIALANDITTAEHKLQDTVFSVNEEINNLYVEIVKLQDNLDFNEKRLDSYQKELAHNQAKLKLGEASQTDIDRMQKKVDKLESTIASDRRSLEADLKKMSKKIGMDVTTGYTFERPYIEAKIDRSSLPDIINYTEDRDETYYEACMAESTARLQLSTNYNIMNNFYGGDMGIISGYVNQALAGQKVSSRGFKKDYKRFLEKIDSYWDGMFFIWIPLWLVIIFPKEWLKGKLSGVRYIQDDPYTLYQNVLDYQNARTDAQSAKDELDQSIEDYFNNYINVRASYESYVKQVDDMQKDLEKYAVLNRMGQMTYEEYQDEVDNYEELQNNMLETMALYSTTLYSFDKMTCGAISALLAGTDADMKTAVVGESYVDKTSKEANYYIKTIIQREMFELTVYIPDDFDVDITDFELWCDNMQIGERTPVAKSLRHLKLSKDKIKECKIRLYNGDEFVDDCIIDPDEEKGTLNITTAMEIKKDETGDVGSYSTTTSNVTGFTTIKFTPLETEGIGYYRLLAEDGSALGSGEVMEIDKEFSYLGLVSTDLDKLTIEFYDQSKNLKYTGYFDTTNGKLKKKTTE